MKSYEKFLDESASPVLIVDPQTEIVFLNKAAEILFEMEKSAIVGLRLLELIHKAGRRVIIDEILLSVAGAAIFLNPSAPGESALIFHELRAPLTAIKWTTESLLEENLEVGQKSKLQDIYKTNQFLITLVNDLLNVSRIESGRFKANKKSVDVAEAMREIISMFQPIAAKKNQTIALEMKCELKPVSVDRDLFVRVLENLLDNAIGYGSEGSRVFVIADCSPQQRFYIIAVTNQGQVIPEEDKQKIFSKFYRSGSARKIKPTGTGLGLFIAKSAVEANGGRIWFESSKDRGTTFYFTVPQE
jgi:signal transduction histidine kinase